MRRNAGRWGGRWLLRGAVVAVTTVTVVLLARAAWAAPPDCTNLWEGASPHCLMQRAGGAVASGLAGQIAEGVSWLAKQIGDGARTAGRPDVTQSWFGASMFNTRQIGVLFAVVGMLLSIIYAALKRDVGEIGRTLARVLAAGLTTGGITLVVAAANKLVDNLCDYVLGPEGWAAVTDALKRPVQQLGRAVGTAGAAATSTTTPSVIAILIGVLMLIALAIIWCELLVRRVVIDLCVLFWPLAVSGAIWANARLWTRRLVDTIAGFVLSKLLIIVILRFAADAFNNMNSVSDLIMAVGVFAVAAVAPFWAMRVIGFFGGALQPGHTGEGVRGAAVGATVAAAMTVTRAATSIAGSGGTAGMLGAASGMLAGGRTPMTSSTRGATRADRPGQPAGTGRSDRGFTPGGRTAGANGSTPDKEQTGSQAQGASGTDQQTGQEPQVRGVPEPPPMPRAYPSKPVPPNLRPTTSSGSSPSGGSSGGKPSSSGSTGASAGKPSPASGPEPRPATRRPEPWPHPRRGDPSAPMRWPQRPPPAPPPPPPPPARPEDG